MEYRLSLTPRLLVVGLCATVALLVLLFALGFQVGERMADAQAPRTSVPAIVAPAILAPAIGAPASPAAAPRAQPPVEAR